MTQTQKGFYAIQGTNETQQTRIFDTLTRTTTVQMSYQ